MANQRMFIQCQSCGEKKMLAKRLGGAFHTIHSVRPDLSDAFDGWFQAHAWGFCGEGGLGLDGFDLVYEHDKEWEEAEKI